jgi:hypothetical protein
MRNMFCTCLVGLVLFTLFPMCASAQRHGRPDAVQNYMKSARPLNQELLLNFEATHSWVYFHLKDLRQMKRTTVRITDPATHLTISYEGVSLNELVPNGLANDRFEVFKESWGFHDKRALWSDDLNMESEMIDQWSEAGGRDSVLFCSNGETRGCDRRQKARSYQNCGDARRPQQAMN